MKVYLIRHAEKERGGFFNPHLRHQDEPITAHGRQQAEKLYSYFADRPVAAIYVSAYQRAWQTAAPLAERLGLEPIVDERLNEIDNGRLDGMSDEEVQASYPDVWQAFQDQSADFRFPGGETGEEARDRVAALLEETRLASGGDAVLICHEGLIRILMCYILGLPVYDRWNFHVDFCGITEVVAGGGNKGWKLIRFNQVIL